MGAAGPAIAARGLAHSYREGGSGTTRRVLSELEVEVGAGEIVLLTGPSGSGKTTFLTLVGALRRVQEGSLQVFGRELGGASAAELAAVRRRIGYVFQAHNLLDALSVRENVLVSLELQADLDVKGRRRRADELLAAVGLEGYESQPPRQLSGGQRQRVAIARALAIRPQLILADEPTASLDRETGRAISLLLEKMAREFGATVLLVTHDLRILDIADRVLHIEDGRLSSYAAAVAANTEHLLASLGRTYRSGQLLAQLEALPPDQFGSFLAELTEEARQFLEVIQLAESETLESMLRQVLDGLTRRIGRQLEAERATLFIVDQPRGEMWSLSAGGDAGTPLRLVVRMGSGIAGRVALDGRLRNVPDAHADPEFDPSYDRRLSFHTRAILCGPVRSRNGDIIAVAQVLNPSGGGVFSPAAEREFVELTESLGSILETWLEMAERQSGSNTTVLPTSPDPADNP